MRRALTPTPPPTADQHATRRGSGGARREVSERVIVRHGVVEVDAWTLNVSRGGVRLIVEEPLILGGDYDVIIGAELPRRGRVVWVQDEADGQIVGVQFLDVEGTIPPPPGALPPPGGALPPPVR